MEKDCWYKDSDEETTKNMKKKKKIIATNFMITSVENKKKMWILDSGASNHMCNIQSAFKHINSSQIKRVIIADGEHLPVAGQGSVDLTLMDQDGDEIKVTIKNMLYVPRLEQNLISV